MSLQVSQGPRWDPQNWVLSGCLVVFNLCCEQVGAHSWGSHPLALRAGPPVQPSSGTTAAYLSFSCPICIFHPVLPNSERKALLVSVSLLHRWKTLRPALWKGFRKSAGCEGGHVLNNSRKAEDGDGKQRLSSAAALCTPVSSLALPHTSAVLHALRSLLAQEKVYATFAVFLSTSQTRETHWRAERRGKRVQVQRHYYSPCILCTSLRASGPRVWDCLIPPDQQQAFRMEMAAIQLKDERKVCTNLYKYTA